MSRIMGDTIHDNVNSLVAYSPRIQLVAGYDTGTPDVKWTPDDWAKFPGIPQVHIDQGFGDTRAIEAHVMVFDVEKEAFSPDQAASLIDANKSKRPTIYVNRDNLVSTIVSARKSLNWKGDIWLAWPGWKPGQALPPLPPGCRYVAIQDVFAGSFDLSAVLDDSWPGVFMNWPMSLPTIEAGSLDSIFVRRIQGLCFANYQLTTIDGVFGPETETAVRAIQKNAGIRVDGIVGAQTWPALLGV